VPRETELKECPHLLQLQPARQRIAAHSKLQRLQSCKLGITVYKELVGDNSRVSRKYTLLKMHNTRSIIHCCSSKLRSAASASINTTKQQQSSGKNTHQDTNQISGQSVKAKIVNSNARKDMFLAFTTVQQIMIQPMGAVTEKEKVALITKALFR
jgi:hypothetical protein